MKPGQSPLRMIIPGKYWDSQIYMGKLYLWTREGSIRTLEWHPLVNSLASDPYLELAVNCAFVHSDYSYGYQLATIFQDGEVVDVLRNKFARAAAEDVNSVGHSAEEGNGWRAA